MRVYRAEIKWQPTHWDTINYKWKLFTLVYEKKKPWDIKIWTNKRESENNIKRAINRLFPNDIINENR